MLHMYARHTAGDLYLPFPDVEIAYSSVLPDIYVMIQAKEKLGTAMKCYMNWAWIIPQVGKFARLVTHANLKPWEPNELGNIELTVVEQRRLLCLLEDFGQTIAKLEPRPGWNKDNNRIKFLRIRQWAATILTSSVLDRTDLAYDIWNPVFKDLVRETHQFCVAYLSGFDLVMPGGFINHSCMLYPIAMLVIKRRGKEIRTEALAIYQIATWREG
jgi:hypothetical protein